MTPDELRARCEQTLQRIVRCPLPTEYEEGQALHARHLNEMESLCREMLAAGLERAGYRAETVAFLMGNDRWKERNALNEYAGACHQEAQRLKNGEGPLAG